ncbi:hypothetical protein ATJ88_0569 [Isoptericola jiangsuensis]|uniref:Lipoprotein n=1 Tax=Isoptericola jiangsuensis TaxID=548579 RepID=A0A2A9EUF5_9MICO|nr:hypothetical protein [Isoptericola jiangsuensis]PFG41920.1 hypothetical protein ATJ88_0569 [Isoptericola jiangsuensis]
MPNPVPTVHRAVAAAVVATTVLALSACGSSSTESSDVAEPAPAISIDAGLAVNPGDGDGPAPSPTLSAECLELQEMWAETNRALAGIDETRPRLLVAGFREAQRAFTSVETPDDVAGFAAMEDYLGAASSALADVDPDDADAVASVLTLTFSEADTARAAVAHDQVTTYLDGGCRA